MLLDLIDAITAFQALISTLLVVGAIAGMVGLLAFFRRWRTAQSMSLNSTEGAWLMCHHALAFLLVIEVAALLLLGASFLPAAQVQWITIGGVIITALVAAGSLIMDAVVTFASHRTTRRMIIITVWALSISLVALHAWSWYANLLE